MPLSVCETSVWRDERVAGKWAREWVSEKVSERVRSLLGDKQGSALGKMQPLASRSTFPQNRKIVCLHKRNAIVQRLKKIDDNSSLREIGCFDYTPQHLIKNHCRCCIESAFTNFNNLPQPKISLPSWRYLSWSPRSVPCCEFCCLQLSRHVC